MFVSNVVLSNLCELWLLALVCNLGSELKLVHLLKRIWNNHASSEMLLVIELHSRYGIPVGVAATSKAFIMSKIMSM